MALTISVMSGVKNIKMKYPKINSVFKRDKQGRFTDDYAQPEFEYLKDCQWIGTEKVDGTNIRIMWHGETDTMEIRGRTDRAQIPPLLLETLQAKFKDFDFKARFGDAKEVILFGEGYGVKIQRGGRYLPKSNDFILFDIWIDGWWLKREDIRNYEIYGLKVVPIRFLGTLESAIEYIKQKDTFSIISDDPTLLIEGLVLTPAVHLATRRGDRIITKLKHKDRWPETHK